MPEATFTPELHKRWRAALAKHEPLRVGGKVVSRAGSC